MLEADFHIGKSKFNDDAGYMLKVLDNFSWAGISGDVIFKNCTPIQDFDGIWSFSDENPVWYDF